MRKTVEKAAEYLNRDPRVGLQQLRLVAEKITFDTAANSGLPLRERQDFLHKLRELEACEYVPTNIARSLHRIRRAGNRAAHPSETVTATEAKEALDLTLTALEWYEGEFPFVHQETFVQFREDIKNRLDGKQKVTESNRPAERPQEPTPEASESVTNLGSHIPRPAVQSRAAEATNIDTGDWISGARRKGELALGMAENRARAARSWAIPRVELLTSRVHAKTSSALRRVSKAIEQLVIKSDD